MKDSIKSVLTVQGGRKPISLKVADKLKIIFYLGAERINEEIVINDLGNVRESKLKEKSKEINYAKI